jgi:outer membrane protein TolC
VNRKSKALTTSVTTAPTTDAANELQEQIRRRAYDLYEERGREDGRELDDWLQAEAEVTQSMTKAVSA